MSPEPTNGPHPAPAVDRDPAVAPLIQELFAGARPDQLIYKTLVSVLDASAAWHILEIDARLAGNLERLVELAQLRTALREKYLDDIATWRSLEDGDPEILAQLRGDLPNFLDVLKLQVEQAERFAGQFPEAPLGGAWVSEARLQLCRVIALGRFLELINRPTS